MLLDTVAAGPRCSKRQWKIYNHLVMYCPVTAYAALAEPSRRRILDLLRTGELPVNDLVERIKLSQPGVSKHLRVLREAGLVDVRRSGRHRFYRLRPEPLREVDEWLEPYRAAMAARLDALERHLEENP